MVRVGMQECAGLVTQVVREVGREVLQGRMEGPPEQWPHGWREVVQDKKYPSQVQGGLTAFLGASAELFNGNRKRLQRQRRTRERRKLRALHGKTGRSAERRRRKARDKLQRALHQGRGGLNPRDHVQSFLTDGVRARIVLRRHVPFCELQAIARSQREEQEQQQQQGQMEEDELLDEEVDEEEDEGRQETTRQRQAASGVLWEQEVKDGVPLPVHAHRHLHIPAKPGAKDPGHTAAASSGRPPVPCACIGIDLPSLPQPWQWRCHTATHASARRSLGPPCLKPGMAGSGCAAVERLCMTIATPNPNTPVVGRCQAAASGWTRAARSAQPTAGSGACGSAEQSTSACRRRRGSQACPACESCRGLGPP
ncbi:hypothetical protein DUNSADRAFT_14250, partial [Dunaliella salina]